MQQDQDFWAPRRKMREPIQEIFECAELLSAAVDAHLTGRHNATEDLIRAANSPKVRAWTESLWGGKAKNPVQQNYIRYRLAPYAPGYIPKVNRVAQRMPSAQEKALLVQKYGRHCVFCGIPLIRSEIRIAMQNAYPSVPIWGTTNESQHAAFQCMWMQFDHVLPHSRGGDSSLENMIVTCAPCNYARWHWTLEEVGLLDPRTFPPANSEWDGLERFLVSDKPGPEMRNPTTKTVEKIADSPHLHRFWWTVSPAIPNQHSSHDYELLRHVWGDRTWKAPKVLINSYQVHGLEYQMVPALFHIWTKLLTSKSAKLLVEFLGCDVSGQISDINWQYEYVEKVGARHAHPDIVIHWRDTAGEHICVVEAKAKGGKDKGGDAAGHKYLSMPSLLAVNPKPYYVLLIHEADSEYWTAAHKVVTWQALVQKQLESIELMEIPEDQKAKLTTALLDWLAFHGLDIRPPGEKLDELDYVGTTERYESYRGDGFEGSALELMIGLEVANAELLGHEPDPPFTWLALEPDAEEVMSRKLKSDFYKRLWHLEDGSLLK